MGKHIYGTIIRESKDGGFWAEVPDLPGCFGQGSTAIEAIESVAGGLETHLSALAECGMSIPEATAIESTDGQVIYVYANTDDFLLGEPCVSAAEAARMIGVTPGRVSQLIKAEKLIAKRMADGTRVTVKSVEAYMATPRRAGRPRGNATVLEG